MKNWKRNFYGILTAIGAGIIGYVIQFIFSTKTGEYLMKTILENFGIIGICISVLFLAFYYLYHTLNDKIKLKDEEIKVFKQEKDTQIGKLASASAFASLMAIKHGEILAKLGKLQQVCNIFNDDKKRLFTDEEWDWMHQYNFRKDIETPKYQNNESITTP